MECYGPRYHSALSPCIASLDSPCLIDGVVTVSQLCGPLCTWRGVYTQTCIARLSLLYPSLGQDSSKSSTPLTAAVLVPMRTHKQGNGQKDSCLALLVCPYSYLSASLPLTGCPRWQATSPGDKNQVQISVYPVASGLVSTPARQPLQLALVACGFCLQPVPRSTR